MADDSLIAELEKWSRRIKEMPEPISYIVTDHDVPPSTLYKQRDGKGRLYVHTTPAMFDEVRHVRVSDEPLDIGASIFGVPVFKREDLPEGWPDA